MSPRHLILGATGRIGSLVGKELAERGLRVEALVRDVARAASVLPGGVIPVRGEFDDPASIAAALQGVEVLFLSSPVHPQMARWQSQAVQAAADAGVRRIVKLSGSGWTMDGVRTTTVGAAHAQVEAAMRVLREGRGTECICIRPNAFLQGMLGRLGTELAAGDSFSLAIGDAQVAFADIRDIAAMGAHAMVAAYLPPLIQVTGPEALGGSGLAARLTRLLGRPIGYRALEIEAALERARASAMPPFTLQHQREVLTLLREGAGQPVGVDFRALLQRDPRPVDDYLAEVCATLGR